jgi:hypothetical protein
MSKKYVLFLDVTIYRDGHLRILASENQFLEIDI